MMNFRPEIAIITPNYLMSIGFKSIIEKIIPMADIEIFSSYTDLVESSHDRFMHFFVSYSIFSTNRIFFNKHNSRTILLVEGDKIDHSQCFRSINVFQSEESLVRDVLRLRNHSHIASHSIKQYVSVDTKDELTRREREVLELIALGNINKEIADKLSISITTVISHRKNIVTKLGIKSVAGLTIYALNNGLVDAESVIL